MKVRIIETRVYHLEVDVEPTDEAGALQLVRDRYARDAYLEGKWEFDETGTVEFAIEPEAT